MAFDIGYVIAGLVILFIIAKVYKKGTGNDLADLWKNRERRSERVLETPHYQRVYITRGIKT